MKCFGFSERQIRTGMNGMKGWVFYNWSLENEATIWGNSLKRTTKGYIAQEIDRVCQNLK